MDTVFKHLGEYWFGYCMLLWALSLGLKRIILACRGIDTDADGSK